ncbi:MAG: 30S ribosomal protein S19 [archaeon]
MAKEFTFKGKTLNELQAMSLEEFALLLPSRTKRSLLRGIKNEEWKKFFIKVSKAKEVLKSGTFPKPVKTHRREVVVIPEMIGIKIGIYNGKEFVQREMIPEMVGERLGNLSLTRTRVKHGKAGIGATKSSTAIKSRG